MTNFTAQIGPSPLLVGLLAATWKSSVALLAAWMLNAMLRHRSAALRHMVWIAASACALAIVIFSGALPQWKVLPVGQQQVKQESSSISAAATNVPAVHSSVSHYAKSQPPVASHTRAGKHAVPSTQAAATIAVTSQTTSAPVAITPTDGLRLPSWQVLLTAWWLLGMFCCISFYAASEWRLRRLMRRSVAVDDPAWQSVCLATAGALEISRRTTLLCSAEIEVPLTFGILRPAILLPIDYCEWNAQRRHTVLRHEMAHISRWDTLTQIISQLACAVYWFNPLAWIAAKSARFERELACDDLVLAAGAAPSEYAGELLTMVSKLQTREQYAVALAMARRSQFEGRLLALLNPKQKREGASRRTALAVAVAGIAIALPLAAMAPQDATRPAPVTPATQATPATAAMPATNVVTPGGPTTSSPAGEVSGGIEGGPDSALTPRAEAAPQAEGVTAPALAGAPSGSPAPRADGWGPAAPALAPRAATTPAPDGWERAALPALAGTPRAEEAPQRKRQVVSPPPGRQTGLECIDASGKNQHNSTSINDDGNIKSMVVSWSNDDCSVGLNSRGDVKFTEDFTGIQSVAQDGFVEINARIHGETRRLSLHNNGGQMEYVWWVNGNKQPFDDAGRKWVANFLIELDRHSAWAVKQRFPALMRQGGAQRVLEEVSYMSSDYARSVYLMTLVDQVKLQPQELISTINAAAAMSSDYETARVLMSVAAKYPLQDQGSRQAFLSALDVINSDYEHARVLMVFFDKGPIPLAMAKSVLESASKLRSDYEHSRILQEMAKRGLVDANTQADFLASVNNIHSDYEHSQSLLAFLAARKSDDAAVLGVIKATEQIQSDYERARVLTTAASGRTLNGAMRDEYVKSAQHIRSDYERNRTLAAVEYHATSL